MMTSMVRELLEEGGVGESADAIWQNLERERALHVPEPTTVEVNAVLEQVAAESDLTFDGTEELSFAAVVEEIAEPEAESTPFLVETAVIVADPIPTPQTNVLMFAAMKPKQSSRRKQPVVEYEDQMQLFG